MYIFFLYIYIVSLLFGYMYICIYILYTLCYMYWFQCVAQSRSESLSTQGPAGVSSVFMFGDVRGH